MIANFNWALTKAQALCQYFAWIIIFNIYNKLERVGTVITIILK